MNHLPLLLLPAAALAADLPAPAKYVDPMIGTAGHGHVFPGATAPFGMVQASPDTGLHGWDRCSGYHYDDTGIIGFSHTHLSGTGCGDLGNLMFMPMTGDIQWDPKPTGNDGGGLRPDSGARAMFNHENEHAETGYYSVKLDGSDIEVELTATERCAVHRYTFPKKGDAEVLIDLNHKVSPPGDAAFEAELEIKDPHTVVGWQKTDGWSNPKTFYFVAEFSEKITGQDFREGGETKDGKSISGKNIKGALHFDLDAGKPLVVKVGVSPVSIDGAKDNLKAEVGDKGFEEVRQGTVAKWNELLGKVTISDKDEAELRTFYTALYHTMVAPNVYNDHDRRWIGPDRKEHADPGFNYYSTFSLWDTFRAANPLYTLLVPEKVGEFTDAMLIHYENTGYHQLPVWTLCGNDTWCMIGYHSIPVIVDAYFKGLTDFNERKMLDAMVDSSNRREWNKEYREKGYAPSGDDGAQGTSRTLEYAFDDWCIARFAEAIGKKRIAHEYDERARNFRNVFDKDAGMMRGKDRNGDWLEPFKPTVVDFRAFTEANAWQYTWSVMQDVPALIELMGGPEAFVAKLDEMWTTEGVESHAPDVTGLIGQYAHGNEPSHHTAYLYDFAGQPWKTQKWIREISEKFYTDQPDGICGNEDCGQMSAWYVFSSLGIYPVNPASGVYMIGSPMFEKSSMKLGNGKTFTVIASGNSKENVYIQEAMLDGKPLDRTWITQKELSAGGTLAFRMGPEPNKEWGVGKTPPAFAY
ncbi:GH92 family glycosyl hydrolase [Haloferula sargassicola]|uniref:Alpha-1,2-mannosidase n=1 Tax=Haloferula sargassicola TaxID=490096 RepID=A0ABP9UU82_9BACT